MPFKILKSIPKNFRITGHVGFRIDQTHPFHSFTTTRGIFLRTFIEDNKKESLLCAVVNKYPYSQVGFYYFKKEYCRMYKIDHKTLAELAAKLDFQILPDLDDNLWLSQKVFPIAGEYNIFDKPSDWHAQKKEGIETNNMSKEFSTSYLAIKKKLNILKDFSDKHNLGFDFTDEDIPKQFIVWVGL
ncbi:hypothetical protein ACTFIV_006052 [Dictyostelium citrinum]